MPQPEALYYNQKLGPATTDKLPAQRKSLLQVERSRVFV